MFTAIVLAFFVLPVIAGTMKLAMSVLGWTLRLVLGIFLLPVWIIVAVVCGMAFAVKAMLPLLLVIFVASFFFAED